MRTQRQKGFSLIEMIISIACIALSATIILQLFLVAAYRNDRGRKSDIALAYAQSALETFKHTQTPTDILEMQDVLSAAWQAKDGGYASEMFFDEYWRKADAQSAGGPAFHVFAVLAPSTEARDLPLSLSGEGDVLRSQVFRLQISVMMIRNQNEEKVLDISAQKHFTYREAAK